MMTALTTDAAFSAEDNQKVAAYTSSGNSPETLWQSIYWSQFKKYFRRIGSRGQCSVDPQTQLILRLIFKAMKARGAKEKFGQARAGGNVRELQMLDDPKTQAGKKKGGQQSLTSWLRPKVPSAARTSVEDSKGEQRLLTSWMRPKSSPAPAVHLSSSSRYS